ncbi:hypothetical protein CH371_05590 [Leptospira wolffii]|uniref:6-bladed beta-propeller n=1 Tax=Leptospira wolffii TaxID=409998 RepID=A0A2M9ZGE9_9LEPT|nr:hypothetical protein [Leptospira wolffii]PJZ67493.1 hypothetical protein CH371_05590 [Leptospira wolffii]
MRYFALLCVILVNCNTISTIKFTEFANLLLLQHADSNASPSVAQLRLQESFQLNPELNSRLGSYYFEGNTPPELRYIEDLSIVILNPDIRDSGLSNDQVNFFILDNKLGNIIYSINNNTFAFKNDPDLKGARKILTLPDGQIALIDSLGKLNLCFKYVSSRVIKIPSCLSESIDSLALTYSSSSKASNIFLSDGNTISIFDLQTKIKSDLLIPSSIKQIVDIIPELDGFVILHNSGYSLSRIEKTETGGFTILTAKNEISPRFSDGTFASMPINSIVKLPSGHILAVTMAFSGIIIQRDNLEYSSQYYFLPKVKPFRGLNVPVGIRYFPGHDYLFVFSRDVMSVLAENTILQSGELQWGTPPVLDDIALAIKQKMDAGDFDPTKNLFDLEEVKVLMQGFKK